jgi:hypothetical protein
MAQLFSMAPQDGPGYSFASTPINQASQPTQHAGFYPYDNLIMGR